MQTIRKASRFLITDPEAATGDLIGLAVLAALIFLGFSVPAFV